MHYSAITFCGVCFLLFLVNVISLAYEGKGENKYMAGIFIAVLMCFWSLLSMALLIFG